MTFAVRDMARSIAFYRKLGFELVYGGERAEFSSLKAGAAFVNLAASPEYEHRGWGRAIFRVNDVDALHFDDPIDHADEIFASKRSYSRPAE